MLAGLSVWALSGVGVVRDLLDTPGMRDVVGTGAWLLFGVSFLVGGWRPRRLDFRRWLAQQSVSAVVLVWSSTGDPIAAALLVVVAGQLAAVLPTVACFAWVAAQTAAAFAPRVWDEPGAGLVPAIVGYLAFQVFAVGASALAESERLAREELAGAKGRLEAVHERLAERTREAERLRIARELHDTLGHHLTALALDLEAAQYLASGDAIAPVQRARTLASSAIACVREAVTELRVDLNRDVVPGLTALARDQGHLRIQVETDAAAVRLAPHLNLALTRVAQEIVTNTTKHARASTLRLILHDRSDTVVLEGRDDGQGATRLCAGHGISGMRERIEGLGGTLAIETAPGRGFCVTAVLPKGASS